MVFPIPPSLQPYKMGLTAAVLGIVGTGLIYLGVSWYMRGQKIDTLSSYQESVQRAVTPAGSKTLLTPEQALAGIGTLKFNFTAADQQLKRTAAETVAAKRRADEADRRLSVALADFERRYRAANARINQLASRQAAATPAAADAAIEADSRAAWEGWK